MAPGYRDLNSPIVSMQLTELLYFYLSEKYKVSRNSKYINFIWSTL